MFDGYPKAEVEAFRITAPKATDATINVQKFPLMKRVRKNSSNQFMAWQIFSSVGNGMADEEASRVQASAWFYAHAPQKPS
jgi:hypothetical protein